MEPVSGFDPAMLVLALPVLAALAVVAYFVARAVRRRRYRLAAEALGWQVDWDGDPSPAHGLDHAPFGLGTGREVRRTITGASTGGVPFRAFDYTTDDGGPAGLVLRMQVAANLPAVQVARAGHGVWAGTTAVGSGVLQGRADDAALAGLLLDLVEPRTASLFTTQATVLAVEHDALLLFGQDDELTVLAPVVEQLAAVATALQALGLDRFTTTPAPVGIGVAGAPGWTYRRRDDNALGLVRCTGGGHNHQAHDVVLAPGPVGLVALTHTWDTTRTETTTNAQGQTSTRTVTDHHRELVTTYRTTFPFPALKVNAGWFGKRRRFESTEFDERYTVRMDDARLASDVFHPRMMEWLLGFDAPPLVLHGDQSAGVGWERRGLSADDVQVLLAGQQYLCGFFARVPDFVWKDLGQWPRPVPAVD